MDHVFNFEAPNTHLSNVWYPTVDQHLSPVHNIRTSIITTSTSRHISNMNTNKNNNDNDNNGTTRTRPRWDFFPAVARAKHQNCVTTPCVWFDIKK